MQASHVHWQKLAQRAWKIAQTCLRSLRVFPAMDKSWGKDYQKDFDTPSKLYLCADFCEAMNGWCKKTLFHLSWCLICQEKQKVPFPPIHKEVDREVFWRQKGGQEAISHLFTFSLLPVHLGTFKPRVFSSQALIWKLQYWRREDPRGHGTSWRKHRKDCECCPGTIWLKITTSQCHDSSFAICQ